MIKRLQQARTPSLMLFLGQDDIERIRAVYEPFLAAFPLCYGYWKKYADAENRHSNVDGALQVYDRGVSATPHSMDLWGHYAAFKKANSGTPDDVRRQVQWPPLR